jgi:hypothetical protein
MNIEEFNKLLQRIIAKMCKTLESKNKEYASDVDKLHNFKRAGKMLQCTPEKALIGMLAKHLVSILDIVDKLDRNKFTDMKVVDEKIGDAINYLVLLEALLIERENGNLKNMFWMD